MGTVIAAIFAGILIGALARLILPGKQNIGVIMTILLGAVGSVAGSWLTYNFTESSKTGAFAPIPFLVGIIVAIILIAIYVGITGKRGTKVR